MISSIYWRNLALCFLLMAIAVYAQDPIVISGVVTDAKGIPVPGATVRLLAGDPSQAVEILTDEDGVFRFQGLTGIYRLVIEMQGFQKFTQETVDAAAEASRNLNITLQSPPRPPLPTAGKVPSRKPEVNTATFQAVETTDLPGMQLFQQDASQLGAEAGLGTPRQSDLLLINGNSASLDAGDLNDPAFRQRMMDNARQMGFQLEINPFGGPGGEGGRGGGEGGAGGIAGGMGGRPGGGRGGGGAGFVGMMGRGGRGAMFQQPKIQGNISETYSNSALNARAYSLTGDLRPKPVNIQNNFSVTLGGVIPWIKPATNAQRAGGGGGGGRGGGRGGGQPGWTFTYGGSRNRSAQDILTTVPTDLERAGDFSQTYVQVAAVDPATGQRIIVAKPVQLYRDPYNPASLFTKISTLDPVAQGLLGYIPAANLPCAPNLPCVNNYAFERSLPTSSDQIQGSISGLRLTSKDNLAVNYGMRRGSSLSGQLFPGLDSTRTNFAQNIGLSGMHMFKARLAANWRITYNHTRTESNNAFAYQNNVGGDLGITGISQEPINWGVPTVNFTNYGDLSLAAVSLNRNQTFAVSGGTNIIGNRAQHPGGRRCKLAPAQYAQRQQRQGHIRFHRIFHPEP